MNKIQRIASEQLKISKNAEVSLKMAGNTAQVTDAQGGVSSVRFDSLGRITSMKDPNQNAKAADEATFYQYDHSGLLTKETNAVGNTTDYRYNAKQLLESVTDSAGEETVYHYDGLNRLSERKDDLGTITYHYDNNGNLTDVTEKENSLFGKKKTIHREFDSLNRMTEYHFDNVGSTTFITDLAGAVIERFAYGTYGELLSRVTRNIRFLYNGSYGVATDENGLYYMRARYYNSAIKRFLNQDIKVGDIGSSQSLNRYAYCEGNPVSLVDPFGLDPKSSTDGSGDQTGRNDMLHNLLDIGGMFWDGFDLINAGLYAVEGDWVNAAVSLACSLPAVGYAVTAVAKGSKAVKYAGTAAKITKACRDVGKIGNTAAAAKAAYDTWQEARKLESTGAKILYIAGTAAVTYLTGKAASWGVNKLKRLTSKALPRWKTTLESVAGTALKAMSGSGKKPNRGSVFWPFGEGGSDTKVFDVVEYGDKTPGLEKCIS